MTYLDVATQYLAAWNAHDADAVVTTFAPGGTYTDPTTHDISGDEIATYAKRLWGAFADLSFKVVSTAETGSGRVVVEWVMKGTNSGAFQGLPPTGRSIVLPGVDVFEIGPHGIKSVRGYFDAKAVPEQMGLQVLVQPLQIGPFSFGNSVAVQSGKKTKPGAFGITTIWNVDAQTEEVRAFTRATATEMLGMEGFIGLSFFRIGNRGVTISAWEKPEHTRQLMKGGAHSEAMRKFWAELGESAFTSVWIPDHINPMWVRCAGCRKMNNHAKTGGVCSCGQLLPEAPCYF